jgi:hypothetical protein
MVREGGKTWIKHVEKEIILESDVQVTVHRDKFL